MKLGPIVHGGLLIVALFIAYQGWTKEEKTTVDVGSVAVWKHDAATFSGIAFDGERKATSVTWREAGSDRYLWGVVTRSSPKKRAPGEPKPKEGEDKPEELETTTRAFPVDIEKGDELVGGFSELKALTALGVLDDEKRKEYGLAESKESLSVSFGEKQENLVVGSRVYGGSDRYVLHAETNKVFVVSSKLLRPVETGETMLRLKTLHGYEDDDVASVEVESGEAKQSMSRIDITDEKGTRKAWAKSSAPEKADLTIESFLDRASKLSPVEYVEKPGGEKVVRISYRRESGKELGYLEFFRSVPPELAAKSADQGDKQGEGDAKPDTEDGADEVKPKDEDPPEIEYFIRTEQTRVFGKVSRLAAERFDQDVATLFDREPPPTTPAAAKKKGGHSAHGDFDPKSIRKQIIEQRKGGAKPKAGGTDTGEGAPKRKPIIDRPMRPIMPANPHGAPTRP